MSDRESLTSDRKTRWPGYTWRVLAHRFTKPNQGVSIGERITISHHDYPEWTCFDELVIGAGDGSIGPLIHVEQMNSRDWWIGIGDATFALDVWRNPDGTIGVMVRDETRPDDGVKVQYDRQFAAKADAGQDECVACGCADWVATKWRCADCGTERP